MSTTVGSRFGGRKGRKDDTAACSGERERGCVVVTDTREGGVVLSSVRRERLSVGESVGRGERKARGERRKTKH